MNQALDAGLELNEGAVVRQRHDLAAQPQADRIAIRDGFPGIGLGLLQAQTDALALGVELEDLDLDAVTHLEQLRGVRDAPPGHVGNVEQAVDAPQIDEGTVVGDVFDHALHDGALGEHLEGALAQRFAFGLEQRTP